MNDVMRAFARRLGAYPSGAVLGPSRKFMAAFKSRNAQAAIAENAKRLRAVHKFYATESERRAVA